MLGSFCSVGHGWVTALNYIKEKIFHSSASVTATVPLSQLHCDVLCKIHTYFHSDWGLDFPWHKSIEKGNMLNDVWPFATEQHTCLHSSGEINSLNTCWWKDWTVQLLHRVASWRSLTGNKKYINMIFYVNCISFDTFENKCSSTGSKLNNHIIKYHSSMTAILKQRSTGAVYNPVMEAID